MATRAIKGRHGPKTRTACLTCRQRRVKCGEERPHCHRCLKAGRKCDGYQILLIDGGTNIADRAGIAPQLNSSGTLLSTFAATADEWQAYRFYAQRISPSLGGPFDINLWQKLVIQVSHEDAAVRNGVFSLGNLFRHDTKGSMGHISQCSCAPCIQALRSYNKAIVAFTTRTAAVEDPVSLNAALASCAVFICIEYYQQNDRNAIALIQKGCAMLLEYLRKLRNATPSGIDPGLLNLFARLRTKAAAFGNPVNWPASLEDSTSKGTDWPLSIQLEHARDSLYGIISATLRLRRRAAEMMIPNWPSTTPSIPIEELYQEKSLAIKRLRTWAESFSKLRTFLRSASQEASLPLPALILYVNFLQTIIYTETILELSQDCYDMYVSEFQAAVEAAETGLRELSTTDQLTSFSFESSFLGMLYLCSLKCREPTLRRRMVELMRLCPEKEGLWHRGESITVASRVIELEEGRAKFIPKRGEHVGAVAGFMPRFHDVLCEVNYVAEGKTRVDATYILYQGHEEHKWLAMEETLVVDE